MVVCERLSPLPSLVSQGRGPQVTLFLGRSAYLWLDEKSIKMPRFLPEGPSEFRDSPFVERREEGPGDGDRKSLKARRVIVGAA